MILNITHDILVSAPDAKTAENHVRLFFDKSQLVHYDTVELDSSHCHNGTEPGFGASITHGVEENRKVLANLMNKLQKEGCSTLQDILTLPQGFQSKILHTMSHLLDGFFGIDSRLYDIDEISHWITENRQKQIDDSPETCWILRIKAESVYGQGFEKESD